MFRCIATGLNTLSEIQDRVPDQHGLAVAYLEFGLSHTANHLLRRNAIHAFREGTGRQIGFSSMRHESAVFFVLLRVISWIALSILGMIHEFTRSNTK
jgi:hypothetical protein